MSDPEANDPHAGNERAPRRVQLADLKPGDRFTTSRAAGEFVVESVGGSRAYRIIRTTVGKVFGLPGNTLVTVEPEAREDADE